MVNHNRKRFWGSLILGVCCVLGIFWSLLYDLRGPLGIDMVKESRHAGFVEEYTRLRNRTLFSLGFGDSVEALGKLLHGNGYKSAAKSCYWRVLESSYRPEILYYLAKILEEEGRLEDSASHYEKLLEQGNDYLPAVLGQARLAIKVGDTGFAKTAYESMIRSGKASWEARAQYGRLLLSDGRAAEAVSMIEEHADLAGAGRQLVSVYASALEQAGHGQRSRQWAGSLQSRPNEVTVDPWMDQVLDRSFDDRIVCIELENTLKSKRFDRAKELLERLEMISPDNARVLTLKGIYLQEFKLFEQATYWYERAIAAGQSDTVVYSKLVGCYVAQGRYADALKSVSLAKQQGLESPDLLLAAGKAMEAKRRPDSALDFYMKALALDPMHVGANFAYIEAAWKRGLLEETRLPLQRLRVSLPRNARVRGMIGQLQLAKGELQAAIATLESARDLDPKHEELADLLRTAYLRSGNRLIERGSNEKGIAFYERAIRLGSSPEAYLNAMKAHIRAERITEARLLLNRFESDSSARSAESLYQVGMVCQYIGDMDRAVRLWQEALEEFSSSDEANLRAAIRAKLSEGRKTIL